MTIKSETENKERIAVSKDVKTVNLKLTPNISTDINNWIDENRDTMYPVVLDACDDITTNADIDHEIVLIANLIGILDRKRIAFSVGRDDIDTALHLIWNWSLDNDYYENCTRINNILSKLNKPPLMA